MEAIIDIPQFIVLHFVALCRYGVSLFYRLKVLGNPTSNKSVDTTFPTALAPSLHVSVSHFGSSSNVSKFSIFIQFVMVIWDQ